MSQIPIIPAVTAAMASKPSSIMQDGAQDGFAELLAALEDAQRSTPATDTNRPIEDVIAPAVDDVVEDVPEVAAPADVDDVDEETPDSTETGDALAAVVDALKQIQAAMQQGQTPDADMLEKLNGAIDKLAGLLGVSLDEAATPDQLLALTNQLAVEGEPAQSGLQRALSAFAMDLSAQTDAPDVAALGNKLGALVKALGEVQPETVAPLKAEIEAAVARLPQPAGVARQEAAAQLAGTIVPTAPTEPQTLADVPVKVSEPDLGATAITGKDATVETKPVANTDTPARSTAPKDGKSDAAKPDPANIDKTVADAQAATQQAPAQQAKTDSTVQIPRPIMAGYQTSQQQINLPQIAFEMARQVTDGNTRFQMRLDPAELGRIDVRLDIDQSGQVTARLTVEKAETLDLMQRDQRGLEKALQQAGLDGAKTNLEFSLKQNGAGQGQDGRGGNGQGGLRGQAGEGEETVVPTVNLYRGNLSASGVNILA